MMFGRLQTAVSLRRGGTVDVQGLSYPIKSDAALSELFSRGGNMF
jgi:hypothetical protein